ncbi:MAG: TonB family protein [Kordiimonadaceae bacterium]|nr:TonB family protein [Kordiimonadaceae bacterium]
MIYTRFASIPAGAAVATFSLFYLMQSLVTPDDINIEEDASQLRFIDFIQDVDVTPPIRKIKRLVMPPVPQKQPPRIKPPATAHAGPKKIGVHIPRAPTPANTELKYPAMTDGERIPLVRVKPSYPSRALSLNIEGWVILQFDIDQYGTVVNPIVLEAEPAGIFNKAAVKALRRFKYKPAVIDGQPKPSYGIQLRMAFNIGKE